MSHLKEAKGNKVTVEVQNRDVTFIAGGRKRHVIYAERYQYSKSGPEGVVIVNGLVRFADGTEAFALLEIDEMSSGEHCGTGIFLPGGGFVWATADGFGEAIDKTPAQIFPYKYRYTGKVRAGWDLNDHHIGADGWSL